MKTISLTQPWASLVALGEKRIETRSWATRYRGPLAIHASATLPKAAKVLLLCTPFHEVLTRRGHAISHMLMAPPKGVVPHDLPLGAVIATAKLVTCIRLEDDLTVRDTLALSEARHEQSFGDYSPGRFAWVLRDVVALPEPIPARGALGLWEFPDELLGGTR